MITFKHLGEHLEALKVVLQKMVSELILKIPTVVSAPPSAEGEKSIVIEIIDTDEPAEGEHTKNEPAEGDHTTKVSTEGEPDKVEKPVAEPVQTTEADKEVADKNDAIDSSIPVKPSSEAAAINSAPMQPSSRKRKLISDDDEGSDDDTIDQKEKKTRTESSSSDEMMKEEERLKKTAKKLNLPLEDIQAAYLQEKSMELEKEKAPETEKLIFQLKESVESEAEQKGTDALKIQEQVMMQGVENLKEKDEQIKFIQKFISFRRFPQKIIKVTPRFFKTQQTRNNLELTRENKNTIDIVTLSKIKSILGFSEICELYTCIQNSSTSYKPVLLKHLDKIFSDLNKAEEALKLPISYPKIELRGTFISSDRKMARRPTKEDKLKETKLLQRMSFLPDCGGTNHILPTGVHFVPGRVIRSPEFGMFYVDPITKQSFQRASEISIAKTEHLAAVRFIGRASNADEDFLKLIDEELKLRMAHDTTNSYVKIKQEYENVML